MVGDSEVHLRWCRRHFPAATKTAVSWSELYFARCYALKWTWCDGLEHLRQRAWLWQTPERNGWCISERASLQQIQFSSFRLTCWHPVVCFRTKRRFQYSRFALDVGKTLSTTDLILTQKLSDRGKCIIIFSSTVKPCFSLCWGLNVFTTGMVFCGFLVGQSLRSTGTTRELKTVAFSS